MYVPGFCIRILGPALPGVCPGLLCLFRLPVFTYCCVQCNITSGRYQKWSMRLVCCNLKATGTRWETSAGVLTETVLAFLLGGGSLGEEIPVYKVCLHRRVSDCLLRRTVWLRIRTFELAFFSLWISLGLFPFYEPIIMVHTDYNFLVFPASLPSSFFSRGRTVNNEGK